MSDRTTRRRFVRDLGLGTAALPFLWNLPSLGFAGEPSPRKRRLIVIFSPNGIVKKDFWNDGEGELKFKRILEPLEPFKDQTLLLKGVADKIKGDGDGHMRGIGCLLTGIELFPGNIQGGSDTPAGWSTGISLDQELKNTFQADPTRRTRFGSLEFGVLVPERADTWTRLSYAGPNQPIAPIDDPYQMFAKMYGRRRDTSTLASILDDVREDLARVRAVVSQEDRRLLDEHTSFVRTMETELSAPEEPQGVAHAVPELEPGVREDNDRMPKISRMQIELLVSSLAADFTRVATVQYTNSVGGAKHRWVGVDEGHHELSHRSNDDKDAQEKLVKINRWYAGEVAHLAKRLSETPEPGGSGTMLDNTTIVWTNELGEGNSHTHNDIPFVLVGGGLGFKMGRQVEFKQVPHNRLLLSIAHGMGHEIKTFGNADFCGDGPLTGLV